MLNEDDVASKIEIFVGDIPENEPLDLKNVRYVCLGYISLANNEKTDFRVRELKSVHVDATGMFLKLNLHKNYINKYNLYNQISVVAINIIGDRLQEESTPVMDPEEIPNQDKESPLAGFNRPDYISPLDDLAFDMYQDPGVAQLIRKLEKKKQEAVLQERYEFAKRIKIGIEKLQKSGEKLGKLEVEKRQAVENEDYDKAQMKKIQIFELRLQLYEEVKIKTLLELPQTQSKELIASELFKETEPILSPLNIDTAEQGMVSSQRPPPPPLSPHSDYDERPPPPPPPRSEYDERPLPVTKKSKRISMPVEEKPDDLNDQEPEDVKVPTESKDDIEPLTEKDMREASAAINVFGMHLVSKTYSKSYAHREEALESLSQQIRQHAINEDARTILRALILPIKRGLEDQVHAVFKATQKLLRLVLTKFIQENKIPRPDTVNFIEKILPSLFHRAGYTALRTREEAKRFILEIAQYPEIKASNIVPNECVKPFKMSVFSRFARSRAELVEMLYKEIGLSINSNAPGMAVVDIMNFCTVACLHHSSEDVRRVALRIIQLLYEDIGPPVRNYLPPDDDKIRKNTLYRQIFEYFDKVDSKNAKSTLKPQKLEEPVKKSSEVDALQNNHKNMKAILSKVEEENYSRKGTDDKKTTTISKPVGDINIHINFVPKENNQTSKKRPESKNIKKKFKQIPTPIEETIPEDDSNIDYTCIFCGEKDKSFDEKGLDLHYWKHCPMLKRCGNCKQVLEISTFKKHLLTECDAMDNYRNCPRCQEAVLKDVYDSHVSDRVCRAVDINDTHCPLCHMKINHGDEGWKDHLTGRVNGCKNNPRLHLPQTKQHSNISNRPLVTNRAKEKRNLSKPVGGKHFRGGHV
ncbi:centrosomal protein of 104 kDa-like [Octopus sinensis]|uniref:Centrosomal protein of 104 kDa-like n=1 Tax=Octopus sinensis TaxID=2607531 RepID=A0A6P7TFL6_9MOLL|nr:centrosomal protein of 104 kDa-like [Octopus sinensis]